MPGGEKVSLDDDKSGEKPTSRRYSDTRRLAQKEKKADNERGGEKSSSRKEVPRGGTSKSEHGAKGDVKRVERTPTRDDQARRTDRPPGKNDKSLTKDDVRKDSEKRATTSNEQAKLEEARQRAAEEDRIRKEEEKLKVEEEKRKQEEERQRIEEENKLAAEEAERRTVEDEKNFVLEFIAECRDKSSLKDRLREENSNAAENRPDDSFFSRLDSSMKKNSAFVRKLKNITESQKDSLTKDFNSLNLTKYVGEAAAAIVEAKLKMCDINCAVCICSLMHRRYCEFSPALLENWQRQLPLKKDDKITNLSKLRVDLRFFAELVTVHVFTMKAGLSVLSTLLSVLTSSDKDAHHNISILLTFCKHCGDDYCGLLSRKIRLLHEKHQMTEEIPRSTFLATERQRACRNLLKTYFVSVTEHLVKVHGDIQQAERQNRKLLLTKGELSNERKEKFEADQQAYHKLLSNTAQFADILDEDMPQLPECELSHTDEFGFDIYMPLQPGEFDAEQTLFEDEETRAFYEVIPDLKAIVPGILYKDSEHTAKPAAGEEQPTELGDDENLKVEDVEKELEAETVKVDKKAASTKEEPDLPPVNDILHETEDEDTNVSMKLILESFLQNLPNCVNRELIDRSAQDFCTNLNTKANRKKLVRALFTVQRTRYDLLPFYARLVATLHPCMPDVATDLVTLLSGDFKWHVRKKDQINIESKLKTVRFIGELVKFKMFNKQESLFFLKMLLYDFSHHNIEMACSLLDSCGRFLYRSPDSHHKTKVYLDVIMRKKAALHLDNRYTTMIENAYYYSNPPDAKLLERKVRPPMHEYTRKLLYKDLNKLNVEKVLRRMRKLNWDSPEVRLYTIKCLTCVWNLRFFNIHCLANLVAGLAPYHEQVAIQTVDGVMEDIRIGMEVNDPKYNQWRVSSVAYLGELYNYRLVESSVVFKTLYSFVTFGVSYDESIASPLDPADHLFRIRLVCTLLDTCGQYFDRGSSKKKLDCFLVYFMRYFLMKKASAIWCPERPFPLDVTNMINDTLDQVRPKYRIPDSYADAVQQQEQLEVSFRAKLAEMLPADEPETNLPSINEAEELEDMSQHLSQVALTDEEEDERSSMTGDSDQDDNARSKQRHHAHYRPGQNDDEDERTPGSQEGYSMESDAEADEDEEGQSGKMQDEEPVQIIRQVKHVECEEDNDFMTAFDKMLQENLQNRSSEPVKIGQVDIGIPLLLKSQKASKPALSPVTNTGTGTGMLLSASPLDAEPASSNVHFMVMTKRGNKQQYAQIDVPIESRMATRFFETQEAEREEKERMKKVVLDIHERQEEEDYQEMLAGMARPVAGTANVNRDKRGGKYHHPKGAPDADAIFGSGPKFLNQQGKR